MVSFLLGWGITHGRIGSYSFHQWQGKSTTVLNQDLRDKAAFGVDTGATWRLEAGAKITLNYTEQFSDAFSINAKTDIFYNYWGPIVSYRFHV